LSKSKTRATIKESLTELKELFDGTLGSCIKVGNYVEIVIFLHENGMTSLSISN